MMIAVYRRTIILVGVAVVLGLTTALAPLVWDTLHARKGYKRVALDQLGRFNLDDQWGTITDVPQAFRALNGKRVVVLGRMWSPSAASNVSHFELVHDFTPHRPPRVQERIFARMPSGKTVVVQGPYDPVQVYGTLHVRLNRNPEGVIASVYDMDVNRIVCPPTPNPEPAAWWIGGGMVMALIALIALVDCLARLHVQNAREMVGCCRACGYDLRASQEGCPECGTPIRPCCESPLLSNSWTPSASASKT